MASSKTKKIIKWILISIVIFLLILMSAGYLWQHFYGEKWIRQYIENTVVKESDSLYTLKMEDLSINLIAGRLTIKGFELIPDTNVWHRLKTKGHVSPFLLHIKVAKLRIRGFQTVMAMKSKDIKVSRILVDEPEVYLVRMSLPDVVVKDTTEIKKRLNLSLPKGLNSVVVEILKITKGKFVFTDQTKTPATRIEIPDLNIDVKDFAQNKEDFYTDKIFNSEDIRVTFNHFEINTPDSMYHVYLGSFGISTKDKKITLDSIVLKPLLSRKDFFIKLGYQFDMFDLGIAGISIENIDFPALLLNNVYHAAYVNIREMDIRVYRDKHYALREGFKPKLWQQSLRELKFNLTIDSVNLSNSKAVYEEQVGSEPGFLAFDKINAVAKNISSDSMVWKDRDMIITGSAYIMGKGLINATLVLPIGAKNDAFTFSGSVGQMDLTLINPMLTKLAPARVIGGRIDKLVIPVIHANNDRSTGKILFSYSDLNVEIAKDKNSTTWQDIKTGVLNVAANTYIKNSNPTSSGKFTEGIVIFERDKRKGIFNYLWKSVFFGIKSTVGVNNKEQRATKKEIRQEKKKKNKKK